ncbi:endonuclease/exonuclease/phosphatase family protein [uncultured Dubosiella sp.]|uniref:endonuclease/exonuclease/phosphatase family protein n=2 Tax=uncultured Dubosiella sp. TaxID=1937011 RepID=UPI002596D89F|nr:endonuclease/exonuclease/phosphatase family protein [uncultured Dubosiella sp.]
MKLLTLNTHSLEEKAMRVKQVEFVKAIAALDPDVIALQEVNQTFAADDMQEPSARPGVPFREDNHAYMLHQLMKQQGLRYEMVWLPVKTGYSRYDEGLAFFTKKKILEVRSTLLSQQDDYDDFRTRRSLEVKTDDGWFVNVHMGWWNDALEPFAGQWKTLAKALPQDEPVYVLGDFNADAQVRGEGYDLVRASGFFDLYEEAQAKDDGMTVVQEIDGWREGDHPKKMRIDHLFSSRPVAVASCRTVFNGINEPVISDHFGLMAIVNPVE